MKPDCQTTGINMIIPPAWFPKPAFVHLLKSLYLLQSWSGELISPKKRKNILMTMIYLSSEIS